MFEEDLIEDNKEMKTAKIKISTGLYRDGSADELAIIEKAIDIAKQPVIETPNEEVLCDMVKWLHEWGYLTTAQIGYMAAIIGEIDEGRIVNELWDTAHNFFEITEDIIEMGKSAAGGWNREQLALLGVEWPPKKGWKERIIGELIPESIIERFLSLKR